MLSKDSSGGISEFITELNEIDSVATFQKALSQKSDLIFKVANYPHPIKTQIDNFSDKRIILQSELKKFNVPEETEVSIKFSVGTEIYFVKTYIKSYLNRYYFDMSSRVLHLQRRKEPRFQIPKKWNQTGSIITNLLKNKQPAFTVIDISYSGMRLEVANPLFVNDLKQDEIIKIKFQIYKRAEITTKAVIRYILHKTNAPTYLGLEFAKMQTLEEERLASTIEDIRLFNSSQKK